MGGMRPHLVLATAMAMLLVLVPLALADGGTVAGTSHVLDLDSSTFSSTVDGSKFVIVKFYATWCGHCKAMAHEWEALATALAGSKKDVLVVSVDADRNRALAKAHGVAGFPTIVLFPRGVSATDKGSEVYGGERTAERMLDFINARSGLTVVYTPGEKYVVSLSDATFEKVVYNEAKHVLVAFFAPWCGHCKLLDPEYEEVAKAFAEEDSIVVAKIDADMHRGYATMHGVAGYPTIRLFPAQRKGGEGSVLYEGGRDAAGIITFVNQAARTWRQKGGGLMVGAGLHIELQDVTLKAMRGLASTDVVDDELRQQAARIIQGMEEWKRRDAEYYLKVIDKLAAGGASWLQGERTRLARMVEERGMSNAKRLELSIRVNILDAFMRAGQK